MSFSTFGMEFKSQDHVSYHMLFAQLKALFNSRFITFSHFYNDADNDGDHDKDDDGDNDGDEY